MAVLTDPHQSFTSHTGRWRDLCAGVDDLPDWLPRIALADVVTRELLIVGEESSGASCVPGGCTALLARLEAGGAFTDPVSSGGAVLRPELREAMLAELRLDDPDLRTSRGALLRAGVARTYPALALQLASWAFESRDWTVLDQLWGTYSPGALLASPMVRAAYAEAPTEQRAALPGLSYGAAMGGAFDPVTGRIDLEAMISAMIADGRTLHVRWPEKSSADARVAAGSLWMLAQVTLPEASRDPLLEGATATCEALLAVIRRAPREGDPVSTKSLTFFHAIAGLLAFLRADAPLARREAELAMMLSDTCGFAGFLSALVVAMSSSAWGNTQYFAQAERYLAVHAEHQCRVATWIEPASHLAWADAAIRRLDRGRTERHLRMHEVEGAATRWFNLHPMHAVVVARYGMMWGDPQRSLARFDSIVANGALEDESERPWRALVTRARAVLLMSMGELRPAGELVQELLAKGDPTVAAVPAARFQLYSGNLEEAVAQADRGIFSPDLSLTDRAQLYAMKSAALHLAGARADEVGAAAAAACVVSEQAQTLVPFALLPSGLREDLLRDHAAHHGENECYLLAAARADAFAGLRDTAALTPVRVRLTRREEVLLPLLATAATVQEIASQQFVSVNTVRKQVVALREKFGVNSRKELILRAREAGLLAAGPGRRSA